MKRFILSMMFMIVLGFPSSVLASTMATTIHEINRNTPNTQPNYVDITSHSTQLWLSGSAAI